MGLIQVQRAMARLYIDAATREGFFADPEGTALELELTPEEAARIVGAGREPIERYARSLHAKRLQEVCKLLPLTCRVLGDGLGLQFERFAADFNPSGPHRHRTDAIRFSAWIEAENSTQPAWLRDLACWERGWLEAAAGKRLLVRGLRFAPEDLARAAMGTGDPARRPTLALWSSGKAGVRFRSWSTPQGRLLQPASPGSRPSATTHGGER